MMEQPKTFRVGIAMAGAVSAGAYTAGVIDYLLETLEKWQKAKDFNRAVGKNDPDYDHSIPMHDVVIEVLGGASAGGMTAAITALSLFEGIEPINAKNPDKLHNNIYDSWVNLNDQGDLKTLEQMLSNDDITRLGEVQSLLNSDPIDQIANKAKDLKQIQQLPPYISSNLQVILTITSLRGVPVAINFYDTKLKEELAAWEQMMMGGIQARGGSFYGESAQESKEQPAHRMYVHKGVARFMLQGEGSSPAPDDAVGFKPDNEHHRELLMECAKATGAFPLGLRARKLEKIKLGYIKSMIKRMFTPQNLLPTQQPDIDITATEDPFDFVAVDGGTINNEPFGEIVEAMEDLNKVDDAPFAVIMIDPFPNFREDNSKAYKHPTALLDLLPNIFGAIRAQAMVKENDLMRGLSKDYTRKMIFPKRKNDPYPIACGSLEGFGGFFSRDFREHDFQLGRYNCQRFLRRHFNIPLDRAEKVGVFEGWWNQPKDERYQRYFIPDEMGGAGFFPIIPDLGVASMLKCEFLEPDLPLPEKKGVKPSDIFKLDALLCQRFEAVLCEGVNFKTSAEDPYTADVRQDVNKLMRSFYHHKEKEPGYTSFTQKSLMWLWRKFIARKVAKNLAKLVVKTVLLDFRERNLLEMGDERRA
jgi:hypothetical protein